MEDNNPAIWEEAYWNTADADAPNIPVNTNVNGVSGTGGVMQTDITPSTVVGSSSNRSNGSIDSGGDTTNAMYLLYTAPGYRG